MISFDGYQRAAELEVELKKQVKALNLEGKKLQIAAILFIEDEGSRLYTDLKSQAAQRVGIDYQVFEFSLRDGVEAVANQIAELNQDPEVTGIIIQKPWRQTWAQTKGIAQDKGPKAVRQAFNSWWRYLASQVSLVKDVDGLHPQTLAAVENGTWQEKNLVLPATARAILHILEDASRELKIPTSALKQLPILMLGRSDIVGLPVYYQLKNEGYQVQLLTRDDLTRRRESGQNLTDAKVIISATGVKNLVTGEMVAPDTIVIDAGEPRPDVEHASVSHKAAYLTPVPGGVGPMTIICLLQNCVNLSRV